MHIVNMTPRVINWFRTYLARSQNVKYGDLISSRSNLDAGIAQGTVLGPLLFIFYMNDCINVLERSKISLFADDCVIYYSGNNWNTVYTVLQRELDLFENWTKRNRLHLNSNKSQAMIVGSRNKR